GLERGAEVGHMELAFLVFRDNAIARAQMEARAEADRNVSDSERREREAQKVRDASELERAVAAMGAGLRRVAAGDLASLIA
ncbi:methyl-accepting chemotaxis protein, partial [Rhizobium leguminosarum]